eukprot:2115281-Rhodomonas_salina.1
MRGPATEGLPPDRGRGGFSPCALAPCRLGLAILDGRVGAERRRAEGALAGGAACLGAARRQPLPAHTAQVTASRRADPRQSSAADGSAGIAARVEARAAGRSAGRAGGAWRGARSSGVDLLETGPVEG